MIQRKLFCSLILISMFTIGEVSAGAIPSTYEPKDWQDSQTSTTAQLKTNCGILTEARLFGTDLSSSIELGLKNTTTEPRYITLNDARLIFSTNRERSPNLTSYRGAIKLPKDIPGTVWLQFDKSELKGADWLEVQVPVMDENQKETNCSIQIRFDRDTTKKPLDTTYTPYTIMDLDLAVGASFYRGQLSNVGGRSAVGEMGFDFYGGIHNGWFLNLNFEGFASPNYALLSQAAGNSIDTSRNILGLGLFGGYVRRDFLSDKWALSWRVGPGLYSVNYTVSGSSSSGSSTSFAALGEVALDYRFALNKWGFFRGTYSVGISAYDIWIPSGRLDGTSNISGQDAAWLIRFKMGF